METPKTFGQTLSNAGQMLRALSVSQRLMLALAGAAIGATLWVFVAWMGKPKYTVLYSGLSAQGAQQLSSRLAAANIPYELSTDSAAVSVPADQLDSARLKTASEGLPRNARMGFELFDTPNWAGSDFTDKVNYQRALEGELERTLQSLSEVESVRVHLVMPTESFFGEGEHEAKAAVIVKTRASGLSEQARIAIPQLVASAVDRLRPENVSLVDASTNTPMQRSGNATMGSLDLEQDLAKKILGTLEPVVGSGHVRANVHIEYDTSSSENTDEVYDPKATATLSEQKSEEKAGGAGPSGVAGTASNTPGTAPPSASFSSSDNQSSHSESATFAVSKSVRHVVQPPGRIRRIAAAVLVDDAVEAQASGKPTTHRKRTPEELKQFEQLASAAIGLDAQRNDTLVLQNISFQEMPVEQPAPPAKVERVRRVLVQWSGVLRYVGVTAIFLLVYLMMLRPIKKQILTAFRELPAKMERPAKESAKTLRSPGEVEIELPQGAEQGQIAAALKRQLTEKVQTEPGAATRLIQSWIREDA